MRIIMLGAPGAGKGTQAHRICEKYHIPHISTGDIFRENIRKGTELGKTAKGYMDRGELVPDQLVCDLVTDRLSKEDAAKGFVLDGFPRTTAQAEALDASLHKLGMHIDYAIDVEVPDETIVERMGGRRTCKSCGSTFHVKYNPTRSEGVCDECGGELAMRDDDAPDTVRKRLSVYHEQTEPLIEYYRARITMRSFDGTKGMDEVFAEICSLLGE